MCGGSIHRARGPVARLLLLLSIAASPCALAQLKPSTPAPLAAPRAQVTSLDDQLAAAQKRLQALQPRLAEMAETTAYAPLPPEIRPDEWTEQRRLIHTTEISFRNHIDILRKLKVVRHSMEEAKAESDRWRQFARAPPNALEFVDDLWTRVRA